MSQIICILTLPTPSFFRRNPLPEFSKSLKGSEKDEEKKEEVKSASDSKVDYKRALFGQLTKAQVRLGYVLKVRVYLNYLKLNLTEHFSGAGAVQKLQN